MDLENLFFLSDRTMQTLYEYLIFYACYILFPSHPPYLICHEAGESETKKQGEKLSEIKLQKAGQNWRNTKIERQVEGKMTVC
jgi:hypothetical protein